MYLHNDKVRLEQVQEENRYLHQQVDGLTAEINALESKHQYEETNNRTFIEKLELERQRSQQHIRALEARLEEMQDLLIAKMKELAEFQEVNVSLRSEIGSLKAMLDEEELQIRQSNFQLPSKMLVSGSFSSAPLTLNTSTDSFPSPLSSALPRSPFSTAVTPLPPATVAISPKSRSPAKSAGPQRRKQEKKSAPSGNTEQPKRPVSVPPAISLDTSTLGKGHDYFTSLFKEQKKEAMYPPVCERKERPSSAVSNYSTASSSSVGNVKIADVSSSGHFVRLLNCSPEIEEDIGGYILQQNVGGHPVTFYRFPPRTRMKAASTVTVWAAASKVSHNPPSDLLWKERHKFGTGPECTTILCKPNGQAVAWYTPGHWSRRFQQAWPESGSEPGDEVQKSIQPTASTQGFPERDENGLETDGSEMAHSSSVSPIQFKTVMGQSEEESPALVKREKEAPATLFSPRSPWCQSTTSPTHPDYSPPRPLSKGNDGSSQCRQSRSQTTKPDHANSVLSAGFNSGKTASPLRKSTIPSGKRSRGPTRSAGGKPGTLKLLCPETFLSPHEQHDAGLQFMQSAQNLSFQPPMPRPPPLSAW